MERKSLDLLVGTIWQPNQDKLELIKNNSALQNLTLHKLKQTGKTNGAISPETTATLAQIKPKIDKPQDTAILHPVIQNNTPSKQIKDTSSAQQAKTQLTQPITLIPPQKNIDDWVALVNNIQICENCKLSSGRTHVVIERGARNAKWMFIGEGPGEQEDLQGKPFVGASGQLLDKMIAAMNLDIEKDVYIANVIKCRPPRNRNPELDEIAACNTFLQKQIEFVKPQIIITLGRFAAQTLLNSELAVGKLRGTVNYYANIPLIVTYHPSYLLRTPEAKKDAWSDLQLAMRTFEDVKIPKE